jgi:hypothetical protein
MDSNTRIITPHLLQKPTVAAGSVGIDPASAEAAHGPVSPELLEYQLFCRAAYFAALWPTASAGRAAVARWP